MNSHYVNSMGRAQLAKSLTHSRKGTAQITAVQSADDETLSALEVSGDWQIKTSGDPLHAGLVNEEKLRRLELIRAAAEGLK